MDEKLNEFTKEMNELKQEKRKYSDSQSARNSRQFTGQEVTLAVPLASVPSSDSLVRPATRTQSERANSTFSEFFIAYSNLFEQTVSRHKSAKDGFKELLVLFAEEPYTPIKDFFSPFSKYCNALQRHLNKRAEAHRLKPLHLEHEATMSKKRNSQVQKPNFQPPSLQPASDIGSFRLKHVGGKVLQLDLVNYFAVVLTVHYTTNTAFLLSCNCK